MPPKLKTTLCHWVLLEKLLFQSFSTLCLFSKTKPAGRKAQNDSDSYSTCEVKVRRLLRLCFLQFRNILKIKLFLSFTDLEKVIALVSYLV